MRPLLSFQEYFEQGIIKRQASDIPRAKFLIQESEKSFIGLKRRVETAEIDEFNTNSIIKDCHDIIIELIRAKMLIDGFNASGNYAHEAEVSYMQIMGFKEKEVDFMNELRFFRNSITYYGKILDADYAKIVVDFLYKIYPKLEEILKSA